MAPGTDEGPWNLDEFLAGKGKPVFYVETEQAYYVANTMDAVMRLWASHAMVPAGPVIITLDTSKVIGVSRLG